MVSPTVAKEIIPTRKKINDDGEEKEVKSIHVARKIHEITYDPKPFETTKLTKKNKEETDAQRKPTVNRKKPVL